MKNAANFLYREFRNLHKDTCNDIPKFAQGIIFAETGISAD